MKPLLLAKIWVLYPYAVFSSEKDISSKSEYAQKMHCLQAKIVQNNSKYILVNCDVTEQKGMGFFTGGSIIMDYGQMHWFKVKMSYQSAFHFTSH